MLTMIAKFELAVHVRQYNRYADKKLKPESVYGLRFCKPAVQAQLYEACALLDFRSHARERFSLDHIAVCLQVVLPWLQKTVRDAQADLTKAKKRKKLPESILREADIYLRTLSRRLVTVSDRLEETTLSYMRCWFMGSHQRMMTSSPAFFTELSKTKFAKHRFSRSLLKIPDDQRLPTVFRHVWEGLQSKDVSEYTYESFFELTPIKAHREVVLTVSQKRASVARENSLVYLLPVSLQTPRLSSWFWRSPLARFLFPDRYACATFAREYAYAISLLFADLPGLYLKHKGLLPAQEPVWKRIAAQAHAVKSAIALIEAKIKRSSRVKYRSRRLLHELKRLLQVQAHKIEVHKVKFTRMVQRSEKRPTLNPAICPKQMKSVTDAFMYLNHSVSDHAQQCMTLHTARLDMIQLGEKFYTPTYGTAAGQLAHLPSRLCEFNTDQLHEEIQFAQLWIDQINESVTYSREGVTLYQQYLSDEKDYHALLLETWGKLNPTLLALGQADRENWVQQLRLQFEQAVPWYTSDHVISLLDQLADVGRIWEDAETRMRDLIRVTEHPEEGLPYLHLINGHPLLKDLIQRWDTHPDERTEQLADVTRRLSHMQVDFTLDFVPYVMSLSCEPLIALMEMLEINPQGDETPEEQAYRAMMVCRRWQTDPDHYADKQAMLKSIEQQLITYHAQLQTAVVQLKGFCVSPTILMKQLHDTVFSHLPNALLPTEVEAIQAAYDEVKLQWKVQLKTLTHLRELQQLKTQTLQGEAEDHAYGIDLNKLFQHISDRWCQTLLRKTLLQFFTEGDVQQLFKGALDLNQQPHVVRMRWCRVLDIALSQLESENQLNHAQLEQVNETLIAYHAQEMQKEDALSTLTDGLALLDCEDDSKFFMPSFEAWKQGALSHQEQQHVLLRYQQKLRVVVRSHNQSVTILKTAAKSMQTLLPQIDIHQLDEARQRQLDRMVNKSIEYTESPDVACDFSSTTQYAVGDREQTTSVVSDAGESATFGRMFNF